MTDGELAECLQRICQEEAEIIDYKEIEIDLRPPASTEQIAACERFLGRAFPPSYRHFLSLRNGLKIEDDWYFMGTEDYQSEIAKAQAVLIHRIAFDVEGINVQELPDEVFYPENLYPLLDGKVPALPRLQHLKDFADTFEEYRDVLHNPPTAFSIPNTHLFLPKHTMISFHEHDDCYKFLDTGTRFEDGEMNLVVYCAHGGIQGSYTDFYDYLRR